MTMRKPARRENKVEKYLVEQVELHGGACEKHTNPGANGDPDRIVSFPNFFNCLVETKWAVDADVQEHQIRRHVWWWKRGMPVHVVKSNAQVDEFVQAFGCNRT